MRSSVPLQAADLTVLGRDADSERTLGDWCGRRCLGGCIPMSNQEKATAVTAYMPWRYLPFSGSSTSGLAPTSTKMGEPARTCVVVSPPLPPNLNSLPSTILDGTCSGPLTDASSPPIFRKAYCRQFENSIPSGGVCMLMPKSNSPVTAYAPSFGITVIPDPVSAAMIWLANAVPSPSRAYELTTIVLPVLPWQSCPIFTCWSIPKRLGVTSTCNCSRSSFSRSALAVA